MKNYNIKKISKILHLIGIVVLLYLLSTLEYRKIYSIIQQINLTYLALEMLSFFLYFFLKVYRFGYILKSYGYKVPFLMLYGATIEAQYFGFVTPSRIGESIKIIFLEDKAKLPKKISIIAYFYDRFQDLYFIALLGVFSFIFIFDLPINIYLIIFSGAMLVLFAFKNKIIQVVIGKFSIKEFNLLSLKEDFTLFMQNSLIYLFYFLEFYFLAYSLDIKIDFFYLSAVSTLGALSTLIPISISGLGVRESIFIYYLVKVGVSKEGAFLISFLANFGFLLIFVIMLHIFYKYLAVWRKSDV